MPWAPLHLWVQVGTCLLKERAGSLALGHGAPTRAKSSRANTADRFGSVPNIICFSANVVSQSSVIFGDLRLRAAH